MRHALLLLLSLSFLSGCTFNLGKHRFDRLRRVIAAIRESHPEVAHLDNTIQSSSTGLNEGFTFMHPEPPYEVVAYFHLDYTNIHRRYWYFRVSAAGEVTLLGHYALDGDN